MILFHKNILSLFLLSCPVYVDLPFGLAEENIRCGKGNLLMAIAINSYILLNTSNKSELATGYGTLYGDMAGIFWVIGRLL
jgi:NAD+ synthase (glutamine-hydrolysing)